MKPDKNIKIYLLFLLAWLYYAVSFGQMRLVLNGAKLVLSDSATLVIGNGDANAITRNGSGHIVSEGESNSVRWNIGANTGSYTVPLGYNTEYLPISFTKSGGASSGGYFTFSTYGTGWQNSSQKPSGVGNVNRNGSDNSAYTIDRFWGIDVNGYTGNPNLSNLTLTYRDAEVTASGNFIVENELMLQRWNPGLQDWADFNPQTTVNTTNNTVTVANVNGNNLYRWWTMSSGALNSLPVELSRYDGIRTIYWETASEYNSARFTVQRSADAGDWSDVQTVEAAGNSNRVLRYTVTDAQAGPEDVYYRLKQTDLDGSSRFFDILRVDCGGAAELKTPELYPNPGSGLFFLRYLPAGAQVDVLNTTGDVVYSYRHDDGAEEARIDLQGISKGLYYVAIRNGQQATSMKLLIQ